MLINPAFLGLILTALSIGDYYWAKWIQTVQAQRSHHNLLLRIHRSYLVNVNHASLSTPDTVSVGDTELPVSRKYKEAVKLIF